MALEHAGVLPALPAARRRSSGGCSPATTSSPACSSRSRPAPPRSSLLYRLTADRLGDRGGREDGRLPRAVSDVAVLRRRLQRVAVPAAVGRRRFSRRSADASCRRASRPGSRFLTRSAGIALLPALAVLAWRGEHRARSLALAARGAGAVCPLPLDARALDRPAARVRRRAGGDLGAAPLARGAARRGARRAAAGGCRRPRGGGRARRARAWSALAPDRGGVRDLHARERGLAADVRLRQVSALVDPALRGRRVSGVHGARDDRVVAAGVRGDRRSCSAHCWRPMWSDGRCGTGSREHRRGRGGVRGGRSWPGGSSPGPCSSARSRRSGTAPNSSDGDTPDDLLYRWSTAVGGLVQYGIMLARRVVDRPRPRTRTARLAGARLVEEGGGADRRRARRDLDRRRSPQSLPQGRRGAGARPGRVGLEPRGPVRREPRRGRDCRADRGGVRLSRARLRARVGVHGAVARDPDHGRRVRPRARARGRAAGAGAVRRPARLAAVADGEHLSRRCSCTASSTPRPCSRRCCCERAVRRDPPADPRPRRGDRDARSTAGSSSSPSSGS